MSSVNSQITPGFIRNSVIEFLHQVGVQQIPGLPSSNDPFCFSLMPIRTALAKIKTLESRQTMTEQLSTRSDFCEREVRTQTCRKDFYEDGDRSSPLKVVMGWKDQSSIPRDIAGNSGFGGMSHIATFLATLGATIPEVDTRRAATSPLRATLHAMLHRVSAPQGYVYTRAQNSRVCVSAVSPRKR